MALESLAELIRFGPDAYGVRYENHVAAFFTGLDGVILVDPCGQHNPRVPFVIKEAIRSLTEQPVKYVVYSHWGADHGMGGAAFADTAQFVGHRNTVGKIKAAKDPHSPPPTVIVDKQMTLELGSNKLDLHFADFSEQDDYLVVHHPASRLIMTIDYVQPKNVPFRMLLGNPDKIIERLQWIHDKLDFDVLVSGHTAPQVTGTKQDVLEARQYLLDLSTAVDRARSAGKADASAEMKAAVEAELKPKYGSWRRFDTMLAENVEGLIGWRAGKNLRFN